MRRRAHGGGRASCRAGADGETAGRSADAARRGRPGGDLREPARPRLRRAGRRAGRQRRQRRRRALRRRHGSPAAAPASSRSRPVRGCTRPRAAELLMRGGRIIAGAEPPIARFGAVGRRARRVIGRRAGRSPRSAAIAAADLIIDGLTGIGGHGGLREPAAALARLTEAPAAMAPWWSPSTCRAASTPTPARCRAPRSAPTSLSPSGPSSRPAHRPGRGTRRTGRADRHRPGPYLPEPAVVVTPGGGCRRDAARGRRPSRTSTAAACSALVAGSEQYTGAAVLSAGGAIKGGAGMVRLVSRRGRHRRRPAALARGGAHDRTTRTGRGQAIDSSRARPGVGSWSGHRHGGDSARPAGRRAGQRRAGTGRRGRHHRAGRASGPAVAARRRRSSRRTPASWPGS